MKFIKFIDELKRNRIFLLKYSFKTSILIMMIVFVLNRKVIFFYIGIILFIVERYLNLFWNRK